LTQFFLAIKYLNTQEHLKDDLKLKIEDFFDYKWNNDRLTAFREDADMNIYDQLPPEVQEIIYTEFLFKDFLQSYKKTFQIPNLESPHQPAYYNWSSYHYRNFMVGLLSSLEPRHEHAETIIFDELDEVNEVIFFHRGCVDLGFEINRFKHYVLRIKDDLLIGAYNLSANKRTKYIYKTGTVCTGFFIRRENWWEVLSNEEHKEISD
jgi:hypothetical protein